VDRFVVVVSVDGAIANVLGPWLRSNADLLARELDLERGDDARQVDVEVHRCIPMRELRSHGWPTRPASDVVTDGVVERTPPAPPVPGLLVPEVRGHDWPAPALAGEGSSTPP
jgi:hypothetical protein